MSQVRANQIANAAGTGPADLLKQWASKAQLDMNGAGTLAIRMSKNVSSVTDVNIGQWAVNLVSAMNSGNYPVMNTGSATGTNASSQKVPALNYNLTKSAVTYGLASINLADAWWDDPNYHSLIGGDLA